MLVLPGVGFGQSSSRFMISHDSDTPGPGQYEIRTLSPQRARPSAAFLTRGRSVDSRSETHEYLGPGTYDLPIATRKVNIPPFAGQSNRIQFQPNSNPGPGTYQAALSNTERKPIIYNTRYPKYQNFTMEGKTDTPGPGAYSIEQKVGTRGITIKQGSHDYPVPKSTTPGPGSYDIRPKQLNKSYNICTPDLDLIG